MDQLRRRLEETEKAMERLMSQMGSVTDKLTAAKITEVLSQAQSQARILKVRKEVNLGSLCGDNFLYNFGVFIYVLFIFTERIPLII